MGEITRKSFYIFLTMLLGVLLLVTVQRSVYLVLFLSGFDISNVLASALEVMTTALAIVIGGWYGTWLGLIWYQAVYEDGTARGLGGVVRDWSRRGAKKEEGEWEIDDLVALESVDPKSKKPTLEYMEAGAVKWRGEGGFEAHQVHEGPKISFAKPRAKKSSKKAS